MDFQSIDSPLRDAAISWLFQPSRNKTRALVVIRDSDRPSDKGRGNAVLGAGVPGDCNRRGALRFRWDRVGLGRDRADPVLHLPDPSGREPRHVFRARSPASGLVHPLALIHAATAPMRLVAG